MNPIIKLPDQFEILECLGEGGVGLVYKAKDLFSKRIVAIKVLRPGASPETIRRFQRESQAAAALQNPNAAQVYQFSIIDDTPFLVMEYVDGLTLRAKLDKDKVLSQSETLSVTKCICSALANAHSAGVIHRDLKPSNIVVIESDDGPIKAKVLDFGIAKIIEDENAVRLTQTGEVFGTPLYMSPEQLRGEKVDARCDIYSLGAVIYECLAGVPPHMADTAFAIMHKRLGEPPKSFASLGKTVSSEIERITFKCLEIEPDKRYGSVVELFSDIERFQRANDITRFFLNVKNRSAHLGTGKMPERKAVGLLLACVCLAVLVASGFRFLPQLKRDLANRDVLDRFDGMQEKSEILINSGQLADAEEQLVKQKQMADEHPDLISAQRKIVVLKALFDCAVKRAEGSSVAGLGRELAYLNELVATLHADKHSQRHHGPDSIFFDDIENSDKDRTRIVDALTAIALDERRNSPEIRCQAYETAMSALNVRPVPDNLSVKLETTSQSFLDGQKSSPDFAARGTYIDRLLKIGQELKWHSYRMMDIYLQLAVLRIDEYNHGRQDPDKLQQARAAIDQGLSLAHPGNDRSVIAQAHLLLLGAQVTALELGFPAVDNARRGGDYAASLVRLTHSMDAEQLQALAGQVEIALKTENGKTLWLKDNNRLPEAQQTASDLLDSMQALRMSQYSRQQQDGFLSQKERALTTAGDIAVRQNKMGVARDFYEQAVLVFVENKGHLNEDFLAFKKSLLSYYGLHEKERLPEVTRKLDAALSQG